MAVGLSGSNGGVSEIFKQFVLTDLEGGILKYEALCNHLEDDETKKFYQKIITGLKELKIKIIKD
ncbi:MAG: hypothetical protein Q8N88_06450 [Nanoarchaeota archaeon]|nr:hypothetical protein [Nanoarchaeota archaeon]